MAQRRRKRGLLTAAQYRVLRALVRLYEEAGHPPTVREVGSAVSRSGSTVHATLRRLERQGMVTSLRGAARTLKPTPFGTRVVEGMASLEEVRRAVLEAIGASSGAKTPQR